MIHVISCIPVCFSQVGWVLWNSATFREGKFVGWRSETFMALIGFAVFLTVDAVSVWGGVFPFLPEMMQTHQVTMTFYLAKTAMLFTAFLLGAVTLYRTPKLARRAPVALAAIPLFLGSSLLIAAIYVPQATFPIILAAGLLLGFGSAAFFMLWQLFFALHSVDNGGLLIVLGTGIASVIYLLLYLVPIAVTAFLIPLIFVPLSALCLSVCLRSADKDQPMIQDDPKDNRRVYTAFHRTYWKSAGCIASLGFISGTIRALALSSMSVASAVNVVSMIGALAGALVLIYIWAHRSFNLSIYAAFRIVAPILITMLLPVPLLGAPYLNAIAGIVYMFFSIAVMLMMVHCIQISQSRGVNPIFGYSFFASIVYGLQAVGFIFGYYSEGLADFGMQPLSAIALASIWVLAIAVIVCDKHPLRLRPDRESIASIEFLALQKPSEDAVEPPTRSARRFQRSQSGAPAEHDAYPDEGNIPIRDLTSKKCQVLKERYRLTARESEIMEYIARGFTMAGIADHLVISENTVRAHSKHIYTKLDIHKRQDLLNLLDTLD